MNNQVLSILIKPASSSCNMSCKYCFYHSLAKTRSIYNKGIMSIQTAYKLIDKAFDNQNKAISFAFQGGEPLLIGIDFYKKFIEYVNEKNKSNVKIIYSLQTNGLLIDKNYCTFFKDNNFLLGISLDGDKDSHDINRITNHNLKTFHKVMNAIELLEKYNVDFNLLTVISNDNALKSNKIYNFYKKNNFNYLQFIPCLDEFNYEGASKNLSVENYKTLLIDIFNLWLDDFIKGKYISIRHIDNLIRQVQELNTEICGMNGICSIQNVIEADGSVYPCDFYCVDNYILGNINKDNFNILNNNKTANEFVFKRDLHDDCLECEFKKYCNSGCKRYNNNANKNIYCQAYIEYFKYAIPKIKYLFISNK